jgi:hypothetical protein
MEEVCERENLKAALRRVKANKGSPGVDGMTVIGIKDYLKQHWPAIREQLLSGTYEPKPVRRVEIPKTVSQPGPGRFCSAENELSSGRGVRPSISTVWAFPVKVDASELR